MSWLRLKGPDRARQMNGTSVPADATMLAQILQRLASLEDKIDHLVEQRAAKEWYTTGEVAEALGKSEYTIREFCRKGQVPAQKSPNGRSWLIAHGDLLRLRNGELPIPEHELHGVMHRAR